MAKGEHLSSNLSQIYSFILHALLLSDLRTHRHDIKTSKYFVYFRSNLPGLQLRRLQGCHQFSAKISMARNFNAHIFWRQFLIRSYFQDMNHGKHQFKVVIWIIINRLRSCNINIFKYAVGRRQSAQTAFFRFLIRGCSGLGLDWNVWLSTLPASCLHKSYS